MKAKQGFYLNPAAQLFLMAQQLEKVWISGRGSSKSFSNGISILKKVHDMPRSKGLFVGETYTAILTNTLLPMKAAWAWFGYEEGIDYVVGRKPPDYFAKPYQRPSRYDNVITWWQGTTVILTSMDRADLSRGGNNDWKIVDEAFRINKKELDDTVGYTIRGSDPRTAGKPGWRSKEYTSSMPYGHLGKWLLDFEQQAKESPDKVFYLESNSWVNRVILTEEVLMDWKRQARYNPIGYDIEVMNKRVANVGDRFYPALTEKHWYSKGTDDYAVIDKLGFNLKPSQRDSRWDADCDTNFPILGSHDWGAFNCLTLAQENKVEDEVRFINFLWVSHPQIIDDLAIKFCHYYRHHKNKTFVQYGDKSGNSKLGNAKLTNFDQFAAILIKNGWRVIRGKIGDVEHLARHNFINTLHRGSDDRLPKVRYNANRCDDLHLALESAGMKDFKKDKSSENNPSVKQQHATHGTDAHDYFLWHRYHHRIKESLYQSPVSFSN